MKYIIILMSFFLFSCQPDKKAASLLFEQGKEFEKDLLIDSAVIVYHKVIEQSLSSGNHVLAGLVFNQLGDLYLSNYLFSNSLSSYKEGLKYNQLSADKLNVSKSLRGIGKSYTYRSLPDSGLIYLSQALLLSEEIDDKEEVVRIHNNMSNAYFELKLFDKALYHNTWALKITKDSTSQYINSFARADIMYQQEKYDSAWHYYMSGALCNNLNTKAGSYYMLYELAKKLQHPDSVKYLSYYIILRDSIEEANHSIQIQSADNNYLIDNVKIESKNIFKKWICIILMTLFLSISILIIILWVKILYEKNKRDTKIKSMANEIDKLLKELTILNEEKLQKDIKLAEIETMHKLLIVQNKIITDLKLYGSDCQKKILKTNSYNEMKIHLKNQPSLLTTKQQEKFSETVSLKFDVFIQYLHSFTNMPQDDCLLCCLALSKFTTKESSFIRGVTSDAIRSQKTRIKKRLTESFNSTEVFEFIFPERIK